MQDIVPKGRSIRNVSVPASRARSTSPADASSAPSSSKEIARDIAKETAKEKALKKDIAAKVEAEKSLEEDIETEREQIEMIEQERVQKEVLRQARQEFEESRAPRRSVRKPFNYKLPGKKVWYSVGAVVGVILLAALVTSIFHSAVITVTPKTAKATINGDFVAKKSPAQGEIGYQAITLTQVGSESVKATGQKQVSTRATGTITIFNNYNASSQRLIKNTRFQTPEGLIFRITESVTVPGKKGTTPGSVDATVLADEPGASYNVGLKDFTIPGFKGDPRYDTFYARSKSPLAGGFVGVQKIVSESDRAKAKASIETKLAAELTKQIVAKRTADTIIYDKAYTIEYAALPDEAVSDDTVNIKEQGTLVAAAFNKAQMSSALARSLVPGYKSEPVTIPTAESLTFASKDLRPASADSVSFHLTGPATFEWTYDQAALQTALASQTRAATPAVLQKFPMIEKADISIRPFWSRSFPSNADKIVIKKSI